ncbi:hypothetical protein N6H18_03400 [Reichenbachiella agarivorans]|uniref:STAS domain-containing protein n=1 Tax=Reichenbachiella agarivorans TaxID=2979464 RepID=A0ABY6CR77_9BACT|nr:hypothetical protein [Reichenbachiella agarivorans]UXP33001.1 hypothetical protein N6H18_03400 [Reichenbachiella agarivorans]
MDFKSTNLDISSAPQYGMHVLYFKFKGRFSRAASIEGARAWSEEMESSNNSYTFVWDCTDMNGFDPSARKQWYQSLKLYKRRITEVTVIADSFLIRGAARVMLEYFGLKSHIVKSLEDIMVSK